MTSAQFTFQEISKKLQKELLIDLSTLPSQQEREDMQSIVQRTLIKDHSVLDGADRTRVLNEFFSCGPIENLLTDSEITEIIVNGECGIWFEKQGQLQKHNDHFYSLVSYQNFIQRLTSESRMQINLDRPFSDGYWRQFRVHLITPPLAQRGAHLSLRRHPDNPWTLSRFEKVGWAPPDALTYLRKIIADKESFLIIGATGTGKTSVLSACLQELTNNERVVAIEDTNELHLPNPLSTKLITRIDSQGVLQSIDQSELVRQALRMRPDRIVMGEVRGSEAKDLLMAFSTGHSGGMSTIHADNPRQALFRLEMLVQMGAPNWSLQAIRHLILFGIRAVVSVKRINGKRELVGIHRLSSLEDSGFCLEPIWSKQSS